MTPNVQFIPAPSAAGLQLIANGTLVATTNANRYDLSGHVMSGSGSSDFAVYTSQPLRRNSAATQIQYVFRVDPTGNFANAGDFQSLATVVSASLTIGGVLFAATSFQIGGSGTSTILRYQGFAASSYVTSYWAGLSAGDHLHFQMTYTV